MNPQKLITTVITLGTGLVATKALSLVWKGVTGHEPPKEIDDDGEISVTEVVVFAAVSAAVAAIVRAYATRGASKWLGSSIAKS
ncbi:MAG TPA: DUF4235 domain-containing protein [Actinotalea caeni]|uniref:DUF4235 domain-containing protein n=1 Tax=Actinotalea caeni TaxID=1348467 RepID=UPI0012E0F157|nr:DUF4235 domain-containing protein [Actinotalea caeni]HLV56520.1 DUF4235 domain-containing protein [Actinotalea caeni]